MEWLKDKKNLRIVIALAAFFALGAGGLIAWELGAFSPSQSAAVPVAPTGPEPAGNVPGGVPAYPGGAPPPGGPSYSSVPQTRHPLGIPRGTFGAAAASTAVPKKSDIVNPLVGPDPFKIPNGAKKIAEINKRLIGPTPPLRDLVGPLNLFLIRPPAPPPAPSIPELPLQANGTDPAANYRLSGVITGTDGVSAILEVGGQSQSVKPGDSLPDGSRVQNIQKTSITLQTAGGTVINLPISAGNPDQGTNNYNGNGQSPYQPGFGGPPQFNPQGQRTDN